ncbi:MAG: DUF2802 domain-containing protein [Gammaproteobacteria bacterium]|nr:DUF2802 domain-containing protein [Gammaproteobacteria bacterium]
MLTTSPFIIYGLIVCNALLLAAATIAVLRLQHYIERSAAFWESPTGAALNAGAGSDSNRYVEQQLRDLQKRMDELAKSERSLCGSVVQEMPIDNAVRMVREGAGVDDLRRSCGLNTGEAQLLIKLHAGCDSAAVANA